MREVNNTLSVADWGVRSVFNTSTPGQRLALQPFEERPARGRNIGETAGDARDIERRHRIAAARNADKLVRPW